MSRQPFSFKSFASLLIKLSITIGLGILVWNQIPFDDTVYIKGQLQPAKGTILKIKNGQVSWDTDDEAGVRALFLNRPFEHEDQLCWIVGTPQVNDALSFITVKKLNGRLTAEPTDKAIVVSNDEGEEQTIPITEIAGGLEYGVMSGFPRMLKSIDLQLFGLAFFLITISHVLPAIRWRLLLQTTNLSLSVFDSIKLAYIGYFISQFFFGSNGGDLIRAIFVARDNAADRAGAALSVFMDRVVGLFSVAIIGSIAVVSQFDNPQLEDYKYPILGILVTLLIGSCIYFSRTLRKAFGLEWLLEHLPLGERLKKIENKIFVYREHKMILAKAFAMTAVVQINFIVVTYLLARSLGLPDGHFWSFFVIVPIITVVVALPISIGGLAVRESLFMIMFIGFGMQAGLGIATSLLQWIVILIWSLLGGIFLISYKKTRKNLVLDEAEPSLE